VIAQEGGRHVSIAGSVHANFQDDSLLPAIANRFGLGSIDGRRMTDIVRDTVRTFLDVHVRGTAPSDFATVLDRYPEVAVIR
jgi:DNA-binding ferritin-like protein (Dps family)